MAAATISRIAAALADALRTIDGLRVYETQPDNFAAPCAIVSVDAIDYHGAFQMGLITTAFKVVVISARADARLAIEALEDYLNPAGQRSVRAAIEADVTLGDTVASALVIRAAAFQTITVGDVTYLGVEFDIETKH